MDEPQARKIGAYCTVINTAIAVLGVIAIALQVNGFVEAKKNEVRAIENENRKKKEELVAKLYFADMDLNRHFIEFPYARRAMFDDPGGDYFRSLGDQEKERCNAICQMFGDLLEYYVLLERAPDTPGDPRGRYDQMFECWDLYCKFFWRNSFAFRNMIESTERMWTPRFIAKLRGAEVPATAGE